MSLGSEDNFEKEAGLAWDIYSALYSYMYTNMMVIYYIDFKEITADSLKCTWFYTILPEAIVSVVS